MHRQARARFLIEDDYMLTPAEAAGEEAERQKNTLFDGVLPPFSGIGNTGRGDVDSWRVSSAWTIPLTSSRILA